MKLELSFPAKPYTITQAFGILNPSYEQFGFSKHNGIDFAVDADGIVVAMCEGIVYEVGANAGAGNFVRYHTLTPVECEGRVGYVGFMYMHAKSQLVKQGDRLYSGTPLIVADNTGFSTGAHTHISAYFIDLNSLLKLPFGEKESDYCFDFSKYYNGFYGDDIKVIAASLKAISDKLNALAIAVASLFK